MSEQGRTDAKIAGAGTINGGTYGNVTIAGAGNIRGDIDALELRVAGAGDIVGNVTARNIVIGGTSTFKGDIHGGAVVINGTADVHGAITGDSLKIAGTATVDGAVNATRIDIRGTSKIGGDVEAEVFDAQGVFSIRGLLNAGTVTIRLYGGCDARDIGGETIDVRPGKPWPLVPFFGERNLTADSIEGDRVWLENTRAKVVRGADVTIGPGCEIDLVEYTGSLTGTAGVRSHRKVELARA
jgi:cytoskeletal protein CcmA (bactofilin family)